MNVMYINLLLSFSGFPASVCSTVHAKHLSAAVQVSPEKTGKTQFKLLHSVKSGMALAQHTLCTVNHSKACTPHSIYHRYILFMTLYKTTEIHAVCSIVMLQRSDSVDRKQMNINTVDVQNTDTINHTLFISMGVCVTFLQYTITDFLHIINEHRQVTMHMLSYCKAACISHTNMKVDENKRQRKVFSSKPTQQGTRPMRDQFK